MKRKMTLVFTGDKLAHITVTEKGRKKSLYSAKSAAEVVAQATDMLNTATQAVKSAVLDVETSSKESLALGGTPEERLLGHISAIQSSPISQSFHVETTAPLDSMVESDRPKTVLARPKLHPPDQEE